MPPTPLPFEPSNRHRTDTLAIKTRLQELLPTNQGESYWSAFGQLLSARITRAEFDLAVEPIFSSTDAAVRDLHNALILGVLYNASQPASVYTAPPKPKRSAIGWVDSCKRQRADDAPEERQRQRTKEAVMALGKKERQRLKNLPQLLSNPKPSFLASAAQASFNNNNSNNNASGSAGMVKTPLKPVDSQEKARWDAVSSCSESGDVPSDPGSLSDRMSAMAHRIGLHSAAPEAGVVLLDGLQLLQAGILQSIVDFQKSRQQRKLTLADLEELTTVHPDLFGPPTHPLSSIVQSRLLARKQKHQQLLLQQQQSAAASRMLVHEPDDDAPQQSDEAEGKTATDEESAVKEPKKEPQASQDLAEMLFPETASTPATTSSAGQPQPTSALGTASGAIEVDERQAVPEREWEVVDTVALFKDLLP